MVYNDVKLNITREVRYMHNVIFSNIEEYCIPNQKFACFMLFLKTINFMKMIYASYLSCPRNSKMALKFKYAKWFLSHWSK